jgi:folate-binding protein YgfZ
MFSPEQYRALRERAGLVDRSTRGRILLTGADRRTYLQGLLTNDIAALAPGTGCYAAFLTPQGRMVSDMRVFELGDVVFMDLPGQLAPAVADRLSQFIFSEDVAVEVITGSMTQIGVYGPRAAAAVAAVCAGARSADEPAPSEETLDAMHLFGSARWDIGGAPMHVLRSDDVGVRGFDLVLDAERRGEIERRLIDAGVVPVDLPAVEACRIEAGIPLFGADMDEETIPLEAGIEDRAISFTKGCYVGQEIVIRVMHRGHGRVARRLVGLTLDPSADVPARGDLLRAGDRDIGRITSATESPAVGRPIALGYVHRDFSEAGTTVAVHTSQGEHDAAVTRLPFVDR